MAGLDAKGTGNELSQPKFEFTGLDIVESLLAGEDRRSEWGRVRMTTGEE